MGSSAGRAERPLDLLFALFQGGGNLALILPIVKATAARGHRVRVLAGPGVWPSRMPASASFREAVATAGATYLPLAAPAVHPLDARSYARGVLGGWTPRALSRATWYIPAYRWTSTWATNVAGEVDRHRPDMVVADFLLPGALVAAEAVRVQSVSLVHGIYNRRPTLGVPPYGTGFLPARGLLGRARDAVWTAGIRHVDERDGLPALNGARRDLGLRPLASIRDQFDGASRVLVLTERAFDFGSEDVPTNVRYVGTPSDDAPVVGWKSPWRTSDTRPLIVVSLSTLPQGQAPVLHRILAALGEMSVNALVTLGPAMRLSEFHPPSNVTMASFVSHSAVLPRAAVMITQCGIGGVIKALRMAVPLVCIPLVGDQADNAARVVSSGAGVRVDKNASAQRIRRAVEQVLREPTYRERAQRLSAQFGASDGARTAVQEIEAVATLAQPVTLGRGER